MCTHSKWANKQTLKILRLAHPEHLFDNTQVNSNCVTFYLQMTITFLPSYPFTIPMRTHFLLEPAEKAGSGEKVFKIFEEWNGNVHLNEKNTFPPILGSIHQQLRRSMGQAASWVVKQGFF